MRGVTWDEAPSVDALTEHFTCKYCTELPLNSFSLVQLKCFYRAPPQKKNPSYKENKLSVPEKELMKLTYNIFAYVKTANSRPLFYVYRGGQTYRKH